MRPLLKLNPYFVRYRGRMLLGVVFVALSNLFAVYSPQVVREAIDLIAAGIAQAPLPAGQQRLEVPAMLNDWVGWTGIDLAGRLGDPAAHGGVRAVVAWLAALLGLLFLAFALLRGFFMFLMRQTIIVVSRLIEHDLKNTVHAHYQRLDRAFYKRNSTGDLMNRISEDVGKVRMYLGPAVMYTLGLVVLFVLCIAFMLRVSVELTLWTLAPLPVMSVLIYLVSEVINRRSTRAQQEQSRLSTLAQESFSGIRVLKAHAKEGMAAHRFREAAADYRARNLDLARADALFLPAMMLLIGLSTVLTIYIGGRMIVQGDPRVSVGNIAEFVIYVNMLTWPFASVGWVTSLVQQASASMVRINEFLDTRPAIVTEADELPEVRGAITFEHVSFTYPYTGVRALTDVSFHVPAGSTLAIVGRTGAGKSTVADLIARQYDITSGAILIDGVPIRRVALGKLRAALGIVPQDVFLFSDSIRHNIAFGSPAGEVDDDRVEAAARIAHVHDDIMGFPKGYGTVLGERGLTLSGGQKQRVSIARAIIGDPRILIFDDALSAVDTATEEGILRALRTATAGRTVIMIAHRVSTVRDADQVLVMDQGRIVERGTHDELVALGGIYAGMHAEQLLEAARHG